MYRIGFAKDIHKLAKGHKLMLGGIHIPFIKGEVAHSDGDVILHAISEALLGASSLGDLGKYFPTSDKKYKNISSKIILNKVDRMVKKLGYDIVNIDVSVELEKPKLAPYILKMRKSVAKILNLKLNHISIKANTNEGLGEVGKSEAVIAYAIILLEN